ncbi:hypothetical protein ATE84_2922 [Aquimarina sp. MAR_2010_214]|uniref:hypothetical protein n=1 Tax=Aquimarina sp. MAR_2010_214 TaxID=1250026 RepID=UPI000C713C75|nr:hypothetical protein [Aquimarina sp. MAR_2010_214]PKV50854.1 hypothetical protein ATE84_2922 [Aquimarina sp. MAR_2010_214]
MKKPLDKFPRKLTSQNIDKTIEDYLDLMEEIDPIVQSSNIFAFLTKLKREKTDTGPYPEVTLFEAANRIMTDLVILFGVKELLKGNIGELTFDSYTVDLGHDNFQPNDITAKNNNDSLMGEAFNVAKSFFPSKKSKSIKKMRNQQKGIEKLLLIFNSDAVKTGYVPRPRNNEYHLKVDLQKCLSEYQLSSEALNRFGFKR